MDIEQHSSGPLISISLKETGPNPKYYKIKASLLAPRNRNMVEKQRSEFTLEEKNMWCHLEIFDWVANDMLINTNKIFISKSVIATVSGKSNMWKCELNSKLSRMFRNQSFNQ